MPTAYAKTHESRTHLVWLGISLGRDTLLVHSPFLKQSQLLALPPLSDMLKFGGLLHVYEVTIQLCFPERGAAVVFAQDSFL